MEKDTKIVIGFISILIVMIFVFNMGITGQPVVSIKLACPSSQPLGNPYCSGNNVMQQYTTYTYVKAGFGGGTCVKLTTTKIIKTCSSGSICSNGQCVQSTTACVDNDGGKNYMVKGTTTGKSVFPDEGWTSKADYCIQKQADGTFKLDKSLRDPYSVGITNLCTKNCAVQEYSCAQTIIVSGTINCWEGCSNGACMGTHTGTFKIAGISGRKNSYAPNEKVTLQIKGVEPDGSSTEPTEGFNVQYGIQSITNDKTYSGGNAAYKNGYWYATIQLPENVGYYNLIIYLYCSRDDAICAEKYGKAAQVEDWSALNVVSGISSPTTCTDSDKGNNYYVKGYVHGDLSPFGSGYEGVIGDVYDFCVQLDKNGNMPWVNEPPGDNTWNRYEVASCEKNCAIYEMSCKDGGVWTMVPSCPNGCKDGACIKSQSPQCTDSDGGIDVTKKGTAADAEVSKTDYCNGNSIVEYFCNENNKVQRASDSLNGYPCSDYGNYICSNGACMQATTPTPKCTDSDGGKNYNQKGTAKGYLKGWTTSSTVSDYCTNSESGSMFLSTTGKYLVEYYCGTDGYMYLTKYTCSNGCSNGACITAEAPKTCIDSDGGKNYNVKGTGNGWNTDTEYVGFYDTCYKDYWANLVSSCSGDTCYLAEKYCDGKYVKTELSVKCQNGCSNGACIQTTTPTPKCTDSDGGVDYYVKGTATNEDGSYATDYCSSTTGLNEAFCCSSAHEFSCTPVDHSNVASAYICPNGCKDSACTPKCTDTDGGKNYYIKGDTTFTMVREFVVTDSCSSETYLTEAWCDANLRYQQSYKCPNGCSNGACKCISDSGCPSGYTCNAITNACI